MHFVIVGVDRPGMSERRAELRARHVDYLRSLGDHILLGGPLLQDAEPDAAPKASLLIVEADSLDEARQIAAADPFAIGDLFDEITVSPMRLAMGKLLAG